MQMIKEDRKKIEESETLEGKKVKKEDMLFFFVEESRVRRGRRRRSVL